MSPLEAFWRFVLVIALLAISAVGSFALFGLVVFFLATIGAATFALLSSGKQPTTFGANCASPKAVEETGMRDLNNYIGECRGAALLVDEQWASEKLKSSFSVRR